MGRHSEGKTPTIKGLYPRHRSIARYVAAGANNHEIAVRFGMTEAHICRIVNSPVFIAEVKRLTDQIDEEVVNIRAELEKMAPRAIEVIDEQLNWPGVDEKTRQRAAFDVLDRCGHGAKKDQGSGNRSLTLVKIDKIVNNANTEELKDDVMELVNLKEV